MLKQAEGDVWGTERRLGLIAVTLTYPASMTLEEVANVVGDAMPAQIEANKGPIEVLSVDDEF